MKLYISGPMTGLPDYNHPAFRAAAKELTEVGFDVVNPADNGVDPDKTWADYLRQDIVQLLECDGVALLSGWAESKGARLERHIAAELGMLVKPKWEWVLATATEREWVTR